MSKGLSEAQVRWLNDPRPYFNKYTDRTGQALIAKGYIVITEENYSNSKVGYEITPAGRAALASPVKGAPASTPVRSS